MSDILNIKDMDFTHANPNPENPKSPGMNNRKMMNTLNVELSDQQTKYPMMQTEVERPRENSQIIAATTSKTFMEAQGDARVSFP